MIESPTKHRFSLNDVLLMEKSGILEPEARIELIEGELIDMSPIYPSHAICVNNLTRMLIEHTNDQAYIVSIQNPFHISDQMVLQPDVVVAHYEERLLTDQYITPEKAAVIIEVSDSTYPMDVGRKLEIYASSGVKEYWIVNLNEQRLEVYTQPSSKAYQKVEMYREDFDTHFGFSLNVPSILPKS